MKQELLFLYVYGNHNERQMEKAIQNISDCEFVLVSKIGERARNELEKNNILAYEIPMLIDEAVIKLLKHLTVKDLINTLCEG